MTKIEKLAAIDTKIAELQAKRAAVEASSDIDSGSLKVGGKVVASYGRGDKKRDVEAVVKGVFTPLKGGTQVRLEIGAGYEAELVTVPLSAIKSVVAEAVEAEQAAE